MKLKFRELRADELEARIARITATGAQLLLYKNARCDMKVLDESVGPMNWQRDHKELKGNMYAGIGIYDESKNNGSGNGTAEQKATWRDRKAKPLTASSGRALIGA